MAVLVCLLAGTAWFVIQHAPYGSGSDLGYSLGLLGGSMMLTLLLYPLRKRVRFMGNWGALRHWFRVHMLFGVLGPMIVLFHSTFVVGSFNAGVALTCMIVVALSGIVGRFIYRRIHHGLYGSRATMEELKQSMDRQFRELEPVFAGIPPLRDEVERFTRRLGATQSGLRSRAGHFLLLGWHRFAASRRANRVIRAYAVDARSGHADIGPKIAELARTVDAALRASQRTAQFSTYERLFSIWHILHVPFVCMLVLTAIAHVVAVHMY